MKLNGYVKNGNDGLHIFFNASEQAAHIFFEKVKEEAPAQSEIISSELLKAGNTRFDDFSIIVEDDDNKKNVLTSPDKAICNRCRQELHDKNNRRYRYPFITCTHCGPRYSIINKLPYERENTSMDNFDMCEACFKEYENIFERRFFSQTNSCNDCGIQLCIRDKAFSFSLSNDTEKVLLQINEFITAGKIIALKGIGGYLLLCDANNADVIRLLRSRKNRPAKPFAVLYPSIETLANEFELNASESKLLEGSEAPIVLLLPKKEGFNNLLIKEIAPGLRRVGVMLPYTPLLDLIATDYKKPLIATSANISGSPIIYKDEDENSDEDVFDYLFCIADYVVTHTNKIIIPQDDSVVQLSEHSNRQIFLRRSRGYAPAFHHYKPQSETCVLSTGAFLKSSFTLSVHGNIFVSQFLGSGESYESRQMYKSTLQHWLQLYKTIPHVILADLHPDYFSHQYAIELAGQYGADLKFTQHHEAHFAAVLAENNLLHSSAPVLGIIWDGTGLGSDGNVWGGEFFKYEDKAVLRCSHFSYFPVIAADKMALEPRISALCVVENAGVKYHRLKQKFTETEWANYQILIKASHLFSSSVGRIFDAVASLLDVCEKQTYEGQAAMYLQVLAENYVLEKGFIRDDSYFDAGLPGDSISTAVLIQGIMLDLKKGKSKNYIAAKFHYSLVSVIDLVAQQAHVEKICYSGGVFQNSLLVDWMQKVLGNKYDLYFHKNLSPNDENISFGQFVYHDNNMRSASKLLCNNNLI